MVSVEPVPWRRAVLSAQLRPAGRIQPQSEGEKSEGSRGQTIRKRQDGTGPDPDPRQAGQQHKAGQTRIETAGSPVTPSGTDAQGHARQFVRCEGCGERQSQQNQRRQLHQSGSAAREGRHRIGDHGDEAETQEQQQGFQVHQDAEVIIRLSGRRSAPRR